MPKDTVFTMKLEKDLRNDFIEAAKADHHPASQVLRSLMREFIQRQNDSQEYDDYLVSKVNAGRASMLAGSGRSNDDVESEFSARRKIGDVSLLQQY